MRDHESAQDEEDLNAEPSFAKKRINGLDERSGSVGDQVSKVPMVCDDPKRCECAQRIDEYKAFLCVRFGWDRSRHEAYFRFSPRFRRNAARAAAAPTGPVASSAESAQ